MAGNVIGRTGSMQLVRVRSDKDSHFTGAINTNAQEQENLLITGYEGVSQWLIHQVSVQADQDLDWDVYLFGTDGLDDTDLDLDSFQALVSFTAANGLQIAAANQYYQVQRDLGILYIDRDTTSMVTPEIHVALVNRNATDKLAGVDGEVVVEFIMQPLRVGD